MSTLSGDKARADKKNKRRRVRRAQIAVIRKLAVKEKAEPATVPANDQRSA